HVDDDSNKIYLWRGNELARDKRVKQCARKSGIRGGVEQCELRLIAYTCSELREIQLDGQGSFVPCRGQWCFGRLTEAVACSRVCLPVHGEVRWNNDFSAGKVRQFAFPFGALEIEEYGSERTDIVEAQASVC